MDRTTSPLNVICSCVVRTSTGGTSAVTVIVSPVGPTSRLERLYAIIGWAVRSTISGWTSTIGVITLLGSAQLIVLGIIGEYVGRLYEQSKGRPLFIIDQIVRSEENAVSNGSPRREDSRSTSSPQLERTA